MQKLISTSTAYYGAGNSLARRTFTIKSGPYAERKAILYPSDASALQLRYADPPYNDWSDPIEVAADAADFPSSGWIDDDGNIYVAYSQQTSLNLIFRKLSFELGSWTAGTPVAIFDGGDCYFPSIARDSLDRLHATFTWHDTGSGNHYIRYKRSSVDGLVWDSGPSDPGTDISSGSSAAYSQLCYSAPYLYCIYSDAGARLVVRELFDGGLLWGSEMTAYSGILLSDRFNAAVSESGRLLGIAFEAANNLQYIEYDGESWSGVHDLATTPSTPALLKFNGADPCVLYGKTIGTGQSAIVVRRRQGTGFLPEESAGGDAATFLEVLVYDDDAATKYVSRRDQAANTDSADVSHFSSGALIADTDDAVYFGAGSSFALVNCTLSTAGAGGETAWEYFDGTSWQEFSPISGGFHFDQLNRVVRLWEDSASTPSDWQQLKIGSTTAYWIRARVTQAYGTPPVGSQFTPLTDIRYLSA